MEPIFTNETWTYMKNLVLQAIGYLESIKIFDITWSSGDHLQMSLWQLLFSAFCFGILWNGFASLYQQGGGDE